MKIDWSGKKARENRNRLRQERNRVRELNTFNTKFHKYQLRAGNVIVKNDTYPASECTAVISETGTAEAQQVSGAGGAVAGGVLLGPLGAAALGSGGTISNNRGWFILTTPGGTERRKLRGPAFKQARVFVMNLELEKQRQAQL